jgi:hypothetical protein
MTALEAKEISIAIWEYLVKYPTIFCKSSLPKDLWKRVRGMFNHCPLCALYWLRTPKCGGCPLVSCTEFGDAFNRWAEPSKYNSDNTIAIRKQAAEEILNKIKAWKV